MIGPDFEIRGFDATSWGRLLSLVRNPFRRDGQGTLVITVDAQDHCVGAFHTRTGRVHHVGDVQHLPELCDEHEATRCVVLQEGALREIAERVALRVDPDDDYLSQWLTALRAARELRRDGKIRIWPEAFTSWPTPSARALSLAINLLLPNNHSIVLALFDKGEIWTAAVLRRQNDLIDLLAGPEDVNRWVGVLGGDWRRDFRLICDAVTREVAPVHLGIFTDATTAERLLTEDTPGHWASAVATREIVVQPMPPWLGMALGADGVRGMATTWLQALMGFDADETREYLQGVLRGLTDSEGLDGVLDWGPLRSILESLQGSPPADDDAP